LNWNGYAVCIAEADPGAPHAMYVGRGGQLGYLYSVDTGVEVGLTWSVPPDGSVPYFNVTALWPDPERAARILFGGGAQIGTPVTLMESLDRGRLPMRIAIESAPNGTVLSIASAPDPSLLLLTVELDDHSLGVYVHGR
jgi:hypothetical protein